MRNPAAMMLILFAIPMLAAAQWTRTAGPEGGLFTAITTDDTAIVASVQGSGIVRYAGGAWEALNGITFSNIVTTGEILLGARQNGNYRSTDHGRTWEQIAARGDIYAAGPVFFADITGFGNDTLNRSTDGGITWNQVAPMPSFTHSIVLHKGVLTALAGIFSETLVRSTNNGLTWDSMPSHLPELGNTPWQMSGTSSTLYAITLQRNMVYASTDAGATWQDAGSGIDSNGQLSWVVTNGSNAWVGGYDAAYRLDGGIWKPIQNGADIRAAHASATGLMFGTSTRAYTLMNGSGDTRPITMGLRNLQVPALGSLGSIVFAAAYDGIYRSPDRGATWMQVTPLRATKFASLGNTIYALSQNDLFAGAASQGNIYLSRDSGFTWEPQGRKIVSDTNEFLSFSDISISNGAVYVCRSLSFGEHGDHIWEAGGVFRSDDDGNTWRNALNGLPRVGNTVVPVGSLVARGTVVLASTEMGMYRSANRGSDWAPLTTLNGITGATFFDAGQAIYAIDNSGIYSTTDQGSSWTNVSGGFPPAIRIGSIIGAADGRIYVSGYETRDDGTFPLHTFTFDGKVWEDITATIPAGAEFDALAMAGTDLYAGTNGQAVWRREAGNLGTARSAAPADAAPDCYPNPFTGETTLLFTLRSRGNVRLSLIDALGQEVALLHDGMLDAGSHQFPAHLVGLAAGSYFVRLAHDGTVTTSCIIEKR